MSDTERVDAALDREDWAFAVLVASILALLTGCVGLVVWASGGGM